MSHVSRVPPPPTETPHHRDRLPPASRVRSGFWAVSGEAPIGVAVRRSAVHNKSWPYERKREGSDIGSRLGCETELKALSTQMAASFVPRPRPW